ncbi:hypothetical protein [Haloterrigena alkaliphila]|uniref:Uncharacterized protein n=1 Tax=Haloterrigena alkaliphila TaxID=2816475 RepID=A0A8A2VF92_9EURY|nr:hypothetical protein [Haloterrigena alkaliphila]QSW99074.1 hypothetical protein J0X25_17100 [Haloterrigena alkaliphila]
MSSEDDDGGISFAPPGEVDDWLAREASRRGETRDDVCRRLVTAAHAVATDDDLEPTDLEDVEALRTQLDAQREEFTDLLEDVRSRVVQVKRETDAKAPAEHDHAEYADADEQAALRESVAALESTVDDGFANFETVLEGVFDETDELEERSALLASAVLDLRDHRDAMAERERQRAEADRLKRAANRLGVRAAVCDSCDESVDIALLTAPECPHCASAFTDVAAKSSFFGSPALVTGEPPALEGDVENAVAPESEDVFEAVETDVTTDERRDGADDADRDDSRSRAPLAFDREGATR